MYVVVFVLIQRCLAVGCLERFLTFPNQTDTSWEADTDRYTNCRKSNGGGTENTTKNKTNIKSSRGPVAGQVFPIHTHKYTNTHMQISKECFHIWFPLWFSFSDAQRSNMRYRCLVKNTPTEH